MFVELTDQQTGFKLSFNSAHIVAIWECNGFCGVDTTVNNNGNSYFVKETYELVKRKLEAE